MIGRSETMIKWVLFSAATIAALLVQGFVLQFISVRGVMPFLYPALPALVGMYEGPRAGTGYALALGVLCDLTLNGPIPCFYTLVFPLVGLCAGLIAQSWLPAGVLCALIVSTVAFLLTDSFHWVLLALSGQHAFQAAAVLTGRELALSLPFVIPMSLLFRAVHRKCHLYD